MDEDADAGPWISPRAYVVRSQVNADLGADATGVGVSLKHSLTTER